MQTAVNSNIGYSNALLDSMRQKGDLACDTLIAHSYLQESNRQLFAKVFSISDNQGLFQNSLPPLLDVFIKENLYLPSWANLARMNKGSDFFTKNAESWMGALGLVALPYCYAAADGAQVLYFSERLRQNTQKRLLETAQFVLDVMAKDAFEPNGKGLVSILKVRILHAVTRHHLLLHPQWNPAWGLPINQEDMAGTNLAFGWISLRGMKKMGLDFDYQQAEDFLHLWNVIGYLLGVRDELLPASGKQAFWLDKQIAERHFKSSDAGKSLTTSLLDSFKVNPPKNLPSGFIENYMRYLLGDKVADILGIPPANWTQPLMPLLTLRTWIRQFWGGRSNYTAPNFIKQIRQVILQNKIDFPIPS
jgi:ER-bound oxygenase mpaB/B'/Rubber oxygenase, catalytic domain